MEKELWFARNNAGSAKNGKIHDGAEVLLFVNMYTLHLHECDA